MTTCSRAECERSYKNHKWGKHRALRDGWFFQKNGEAWCPEHIPSWVKAWKETQKS